jgi:hypothetical protein
MIECVKTKDNVQVSVLIVYDTASLDNWLQGTDQLVTLNYILEGENLRCVSFYTQRHTTDGMTPLDE